MKFLTKEWKNELNWYEEVVCFLKEKGYSSLAEWREQLEMVAGLANRETELMEQRVGLELSVDDYVCERIRDIEFGDQLKIIFDMGSICVNEYNVLEQEQIDLSKDCYLAAVEFCQESQGNLVEIHCLIEEGFGADKKYSYITVSGKSISAEKN